MVLIEDARRSGLPSEATFVIAGQSASRVGYDVNSLVSIPPRTFPLRSAAVRIETLSAIVMSLAVCHYIALAKCTPPSLDRCLCHKTYP